MEALLGSHKVAAVARALHSLSQLNPTNRDAIIDAIDDLRELATALDLDARVRAPTVRVKVPLLHGRRS